MEIQDVEKLLGAQNIGSYVWGHMGCQILRFERRGQREGLVVKFAPKTNQSALNEVRANLFGYRQMNALGMSEFVPPNLGAIATADGEGIVMRDLGHSMKVLNGGSGSCVLLQKHFMRAIPNTLAHLTKLADSGIPEFVNEVMAHMGRFTHEGVPELSALLEKADWSGNWGKSALMLLDFTPDNLFVHGAGVSFIDPWMQGTYLGNPAVSVGQFVTNMQRVGMREAVEVGRMLETKCIAELPPLLGCEVSAVKRAFRLGCTLQFVLSSYVRRESDKGLAGKLMAWAHELWK